MDRENTETLNRDNVESPPMEDNIQGMEMSRASPKMVVSSSRVKVVNDIDRFSYDQTKNILEHHNLKDSDPSADNRGSIDDSDICLPRLNPNIKISTKFEEPMI
jgi:hypothetical protein